MLKTELLNEAKATHYPNHRACRLAEQSLSASTIVERRTVLGRRITAISKAFHVLRYLTFFGVSIAFYGLTIGQITKPAVDMPTSIMFGAVFSLFVGLASLLALWALQSAIHHMFANKEDAELLEPIAGTGDCELALRNLEKGGASVKRWRDLAIAERGQLHRFDAHMLSALQGVYLIRTAREARQAEVDAACRKVHGIHEVPAG